MRSRERLPNTTPTSLATSDSRVDTREDIIDDHNGEATVEGKVELRDTLVIETTDGRKYSFEIVGLVEDDENNGFAVAYSEQADEFVVTDANGTLLEDEELAQEILDDFFVLAEESASEES